jgi:hypothetical protein
MNLVHVYVSILIILNSLARSLLYPFALVVCEVSGSDGWMDGWMDGWLTAAPNTRHLPTAGGTKAFR